jgi:signal transduction histidine kinase
VLKTRLARLVPAVYRALREAEERKERKRAEERLRDSHEQLRALSVYLQYIREEERTRIAREVHDELGQALTGLKMDVAWLRNRLPRDAKALLEKTQAMAATMDATIQTVRRIATELRPGILDDLGLVAAIEWQANEFQAHTGIRCHVTTQLSKTFFDQDVNTTFFRIFQETLTNIMRHARATRVDVTLNEEARCLVLMVRDNGRGITEAEIASTKSIGLLGMRERAALLGGALTITGTPKKGTVISVRIPITSPAGTRKNHHENPNRGRSRGGTPRLEANSGR